MRLYTKIILLIVAITLSVGLGSSLMVSRMMHNALESELRDQAVFAVRSLAAHVANNVINGEVVEVNEVRLRPDPAQGLCGLDLAVGAAPGDYQALHALNLPHSSTSIAGTGRLYLRKGPLPGGLQTVQVRTHLQTIRPADLEPSLCDHTTDAPEGHAPEMLLELPLLFLLAHQ